MALARWQASIVDGAGNVVPGATVEVRDETSGLLVALWADREGAEPLGNPFTADVDGFAAFFATGGEYRIDVSSGAFASGWRYVSVGGEAVPLLSSIGAVIDGGDDEIPPGQQADVYVPFSCRIVDWVILADRSGSIQVDAWRVDAGEFPPDDGDSITGSAPPSVVAAQIAQGSDLTGWEVDVPAGSVLRFNVDSCATIRRAGIQLNVLKT